MFEELEQKLLGLMSGEFSSLSIEYNRVAGYYKTAQQEIESNTQF